MLCTLVAVLYKIYKPAKASTQSGVGGAKFWHLKVELSDSYYIDHLVGWIGSRNPIKQVVLKFDSLECAVAYAQKCGGSYVIEVPNSSKKVPKSYASNFLS